MDMENAKFVHDLTAAKVTAEHRYGVLLIELERVRTITAEFLTEGAGRYDYRTGEVLRPILDDVELAPGEFVNGLTSWGDVEQWREDAAEKLREEQAARDAARAERNEPMPEALDASVLDTVADDAIPL